METFSALLALCAGNSPVTGEFPSERPVTRSFAVFFDLYLNTRLSKQSWGWWFRHHRAHYDVIVIINHLHCRLGLRSTVVHQPASLPWCWPSTWGRRTHWFNYCCSRERILITVMVVAIPLLTLQSTNRMFGPWSGLFQKMWTWRCEMEILWIRDQSHNSLLIAVTLLWTMEIRIFFVFWITYVSCKYCLPHGQTVWGIPSPLSTHNHDLLSASIPFQSFVVLGVITVWVMSYKKYVTYYVFFLIFCPTRFHWDIYAGFRYAGHWAGISAKN